LLEPLNYMEESLMTAQAAGAAELHGGVAYDSSSCWEVRAVSDKEGVYNTYRQKSLEPQPPLTTFVKVGVRGERFRCCVKSIRGDGALLRVVDNDLLKSPWRRGEEIVLQRNHVLETSEPADGMTFRSLRW